MENSSNNRFFSKAGRYIKKFILLSCMVCLLGETAVGQGITAYAAGAGTETTQAADAEATKKESEKNESKKVEIGKKTSASAYIKAEDWPSGPSVSAYTAVLMDAETGTVLYAKNPDTQMYPASITKIMTALLTLEHSKLTDTLVCKGEALDALPPNYVALNIQEGEEMSVEDCMGALLLYSANDAANALAVHDAGSIAAFAELMNERAEQAGAKNTHFNNPSGLHETKHYTTAYDMCRIMRECVQYDDFRRLAGSRVYTLEANNKRKEELTIYAKDKMLFPTSGYYYDNIVCGKTGYTDEAGNTLVSYAEKDGMKLVCCVMKTTGNGGIYKDTEALFEFGFNNFSMVDASEADERFTLKDAGIFASEDMASVASFNIEIPEKSLVVLPSGVGLNKVDTDIRYLSNPQDGCFAEIDYLYQDMIVGTARLKMSSTVVDSTESFDFDSHMEVETLAGESGKDNSGNSALGDIWSQTKNIDVRIVIGIVVALVVIAAIVVIMLIRQKDDRIDFSKNRRRRRRH